jgi:hypothetical protein
MKKSILATLQAKEDELREAREVVVHKRKRQRDYHARVVGRPSKGVHSREELDFRKLVALQLRRDEERAKASLRSPSG